MATGVLEKRDLGHSHRIMESLSTQTTPSRRTSALSRTAERAFLAAALLLLVLGVALSLSSSLSVPALALRWIGLALFLPVAWYRRSLLIWTFYAMIAGVVLGLDAPHFAGQLRIVGDIFLRLIRMIVAPLIFGGIVTGIAGHNELK